MQPLLKSQTGHSNGAGAWRAGETQDNLIFPRLQLQGQERGRRPSGRGSVGWAVLASHSVIQRRKLHRLGGQAIRVG